MGFLIRFMALSLSLLLLPLMAFAAEKQVFFAQSQAHLAGFQMVRSDKSVAGLLQCVKTRCVKQLKKNDHTLLLTTLGVQGNSHYQRLAQYYKGVKVAGGEVTLVSKENAAAASALASGQLIKGIAINTLPTISQPKAITTATSDYFAKASGTASKQRASLQIRKEQGKLRLTYWVSFRVKQPKAMPVLPIYIIDAHSGAILNHWNNLQHLSSVKNNTQYHMIDEVGAGGNELVAQYWYGLDGLPPLAVSQEGKQCIMDNGLVKLVDLHHAWDYDNLMTRPLRYTCGHTPNVAINGGYSPENDAYYFGNIIISMYQQWYQTNALQYADGSAMPLVMRVHFGEHFDNAFWNGLSMSFGDGDTFYPLVSLDVAGHEVSHGFTQQHANLEYHDLSGALNESFSDMAGVAARAFLLEKNPLLHQKVYNSDQLSFGIGESIIKPNTPSILGNALRYMQQPSDDGVSADCVDRALAEKSGERCTMSYREVFDKAIVIFSDPLAPEPNGQDMQGYLVHTGSGVFNKAFYLLAQSVGVKQAFALFLRANTMYWGPRSDFEQAACGVIQAAKDTQQPLAPVIAAFDGVGVDTSWCGRHSG